MHGLILINRDPRAVDIVVKRLTERSPPEAELVFLDDKDSKLVCNLVEFICNAHLESTVNCTGRPGSWKSSEM